MFIKTRDYTVWTKNVNGGKRYFIQYHGQAASPTCEISIELFSLYIGEFYHIQENQRNEQRRHIDNGVFDDIYVSIAETDEDIRLTLYAVEAALKKCTEIQQRRFKLYYYEGYSFVEIAKMEQCDSEAVRRSIKAATKKIKNIFLDGRFSPDF